MPKDLLILCHPDQSGLDPAQRVTKDLKDSRKRNAQRLGVWMASQDLVPDVVLCDTSAALRTAAEKACKAAGVNEEIVQVRSELDSVSVSALPNVLADLQSSSSCALFAMSASVAVQFATHVCDHDAGPELESIDAETDTLLHLCLTSDWAKLRPRCGNLVQTLDPATLPKTFPFPGVDGDEQRPRPAYYYRQSAVIPFRFRDGQLEVLVVSNSKRKRWGVPKGIHDPGKTAQASAANEAREEAGVLGNVLDIELGQYTYPKWGATCDVRVFPMEVTDVLAPDDWPESHRGRQWLPHLSAADRVHQNELKMMIRNLPQRVAGGKRSWNDHG